VQIDAIGEVAEVTERALAALRSGSTGQSGADD
jgi:hypothetical protein